MNSAINSILPLASLNLKVPIKANQQTNSGFGSVLQSAMGADPPIPSDMAVITEGRISVIKDLLVFLKLERLSDTGEENAAVAPTVNQQGNSHILQVLSNESGNDEDALADFLASIKELDLEQEVDDFSLNSQSLLSANVMDLYTILKKVTALSEEEWQDLPLSGVVNLLKMVKIQSILSENKDMTQDEAAIQKQMNRLLEGITGKLEKWVSNQSKSEIERSFNTLEKGQTNSIETLKSAFSQSSGSDKVNKDGAVGSDLTLQSTDSGKHQGPGMPFFMTKLEQFVLTAPKGGQTISQEEFVKQFENILSKANFSGTNGVNKLVIRLNPEHLGSLRIELIQKDGMLSAKILATTSQAKDMLENQIHGLKQAFSGQNIQIERIEISQAFNAFNSEKFSQKDAEEHNEQQESKEENNDETESEFMGSLADALLNLEV
ncbi:MULTISPECIES: flagellar hook-length control protein FliK [unclassified Bacillus (in: firmicutes)]|uniref:flagellar hook-length control protein FliK n=1 Tax=unclassified Bacillus (in: firmicutes) TaxID=185979 RepID=UPI001BE6E6CD|nr:MULTISPECIES: flagellar hook-length control protein FliK [unclassified Bacillus (in: firmicutes)]MBT2615660.1 flagellar hook-length control protein FliK [Bacillus sp. ISL-78]MBT2628797.1 flagellar hook-length control protein FliK [Bacillus sp. ISL-101]